MRSTVIRTDANDLFGGLKGLIVDQVYGAQVVLASLVLAMDDAPRGRLSAEGEKAFERLWSTQLTSGPDKGNWLWSDFDLDPWETKDAAFYGAALGALATGLAPADYQSRPEIQENVAALRAYLREGQAAQPLHNRLFLLWASSKLRDLLPDADKQAILDDVWRKQEADGGWTIQSLWPVEEARQGAGRGGLEQLRHRANCIRGRASRGPAVAGGLVEGASVASDPSGPSGRLLGRGIDESQTRPRNSPREVHDRRCHRLRHGRLAGSRPGRCSADRFQFEAAQSIAGTHGSTANIVELSPEVPTPLVVPKSVRRAEKQALIRRPAICAAREGM